MKFGMERRGRLRAGLTRARDEGTQLPRIPSKAEAAIRAALAAGKGICGHIGDRITAYVRLRVQYNWCTFNGGAYMKNFGHSW